MRILLHSSGTMGDHLPIVALGAALASRGHEATVAANEAVRGVVVRSGLSFAPLPEPVLGPEEARRDAWAWDHWHHPDIFSDPRARGRNADAFAAVAAALADHAGRADLLVSTSLRAHGLVAHRVSGTPWITLSVNPYAFWLPVDPEERRRLEEVERRPYGALAAAVAMVLADLGVPCDVPPWSRGWCWSRHVLLASSPVFSRPDLAQLAPDRSIDMTGFLFDEGGGGAPFSPDPEVEEFCGRRPLALSFSSQPLEEPARILATHVAAARIAGLPLLVQRGWAGFSAEMLPDGADRGELLFADHLPHDWLFARARCAILHGGIGSIARALRQGCPMLVEPFGNDQIYNASRIHHLGVGAVIHPFRATAEGMAAVLREGVLTDAMRERCRGIGRRIAAEDGLGKACDLIEAFLADPEFDAGGGARPLADLLEPGRQKGMAAPATAAAPAAAEIPRILHQTWKDADLPDDLAAWRRTWLANHPGWEHRLWTDEDNRRLIARDYPWFLPVYDAYPAGIMRADAARYFILHRFGGVYADLDTESLRPIDPLLSGKALLLGLEPETHLDSPLHRERPERIVCNALMASAPGHPFWPHLFRLLVARRRAPGPLDATGPFLLTSACDSWAGPGAVSIEKADLLYPIDNTQRWKALPEGRREEIRRTAFAVHHWRGEWWRDREPCRLALLERGEPCLAASLAPRLLRARLPRPDARPRVSCLMVTRDRPGLARRAVECWRRQTWANRELVVVDDGRDGTLAAWIATLAADEGIVLLRLPDEGRTLGELRNVALAKASGELVAQWDDDDLSDPDRLELEVAAMLFLGADACTLERQGLWWPERSRMAVSCRRIWEGSLVARKDLLGPYPEQRRGEDTPVLERLVAAGSVAMLDRPDLYTYVFHGSNTFDEGHWEAHWLAATERLEGEAADRKARGIAGRLGIDLPVPGTPAPARAVVGPVIDAPTPAAIVPGEEPYVLVATPVKDAAPFLPRFLDNLRSLDYPHDRLRIAFLEGDSTDGTWDALQALLPVLRAEFGGAVAFRHDFHFRIDGSRWAPGIQRARRSVMARARNELLSRALGEESWVLWIDVDVDSWPPDALRRMLACGGEIVVPNCISSKDGSPFDMNTFVLAPGADTLDWERHVVDGILQPPKGFGRLYLDQLRDREIVEVDGVGATMLLVRADLHREGLVFPVAPYRRFIETEGLAYLARDMGHRCWGLPNLVIHHP